MINPDFNPFPNLESKRLILREMNADDAQAYYDLRTNDRVMAFLDRDKCPSLDAAKEFLINLVQERKDNKNINWGLTLKPNDHVIGTICYWRMDKAHHRAEIGYNLMPDHHRKGIMNEAVQLVLAYGFDQMELHSVEAQVNPFNDASIALLLKNNFVKEGHFKENYFWKGKFSDTGVYSLLKSNFRIQ